MARINLAQWGSNAQYSYLSNARASSVSGVNVCRATRRKITFVIHSARLSREKAQVFQMVTHVLSVIAFQYPEDTSAARRLVQRCYKLRQ